jgi:hypothetical protein
MKCPCLSWLSAFGAVSILYLVYVCVIVVLQGLPHNRLQVSAEVLSILLNLLFVVLVVNAGLRVWTDWIGLKKPASSPRPQLTSTVGGEGPSPPSQVTGGES